MRERAGRDLRKFQSEHDPEPGCRKRRVGESQETKMPKEQKGTSIAQMAGFYMKSNWGRAEGG